MLLASVSCNKNVKPDIPKAEDCSFTASLSDYTKTSVIGKGDGFRTVWTSGDVLVVNGYLSRPLTVSEPSSTARFYVDNYLPHEGETMNVLYKGSSKDWTPDSFTIPAAQTYSAGNYPCEAAPMWGAFSYGEEVTMYNLCSLLGFTFRSAKETSVTSLVLQSRGSEALCGRFNMGYSQGCFNGNFVQGGDNASSISISFDAPVRIPAGGSVSIYVPVLAASYSRGFSAKVCSGDRYALYEMFTSGVQLEPSAVCLLPEAEFRPDNAVYSLEDYPDNVLFDTQLFSAGTYNILAASGRSDCPANTWDAAKASIASIIMNMDCDIMTLNELCSTEVDDISAMISGYSWVTKNNSYKSAQGCYEMSYCPGIIYKSMRFEKIDDGIFWLCDPDTDHLITDNKTGAYQYTDPADGTVYKAGQARCCVWAKFNDLVTGRDFYWFAPHPHIRGTDSASSLAATETCLNAGNVRSLLKQIPYVNTEGLPYIVAGDFNTQPAHVTYKSVLAKTDLVNAFESALENGVLDPTTAVKPSTNPGYMPQNYSYGASGRIDHIYTSGFVTRSYRHIYTMYDNGTDGRRFPSDHIPVRTVMSFE